MKNLKFALFLALSIVFCAPKSNAQDPATAAAVASGVKKAVSYAIANWDKISWVLGGMKHTWWYCQYEDGFTTYNNFRSYRGPDNIYNYFVLGHGDCDSRYYDTNGKLQPICYSTPLHASRYTDEHGKIVDIGFQVDGGKYKSLFDY